MYAEWTTALRRPALDRTTIRLQRVNGFKLRRTITLDPINKIKTGQIRGAVYKIVRLRMHHLTLTVELQCRYVSPPVAGQTTPRFDGAVPNNLYFNLTR